MPAASNRRTPTRTCVGCATRDEQSALLRLRLASGGAIVVAAQGNGRSAYVHSRAGCVAALARSKGLARSLRTAVASDRRRDLVHELQQRLTESTSA